MTRAVRRAGGRAVVCLALSLPASPPDRLPAQDVDRGKAVYDKWCAPCHGENGAGNGPAARYMLPRPRDFVQAFYQIRSTASGELPTDGDLMRVIDDGLPGTAMPGWRRRLSADDRRAVLAYVKTFSTFFAGAAPPPEPLRFGGAPGGGDEAIRVGRQFYDSIGCAKCHGERGLGDGPSAPELEDDTKLPIYAANLAQSWRFNGGGTVEAIYRSLRTGLDGTPMPSFSDLVDQGFLTDRELWHLARYVRSLSPREPPRVRDVILAARVEGSLPASPDDSAWAAVDEYWFPLVGQIVGKGRWFGPAVTDVRVRAIHDGEALALRVAWYDRSRSPDSAWVPFARKVLAALAGDDTVPPVVQPWPDRVAVQFPRRIPAGMERPYFLMGSSDEPAYQWRWRSEGGGEEGTARGLERYEPQPGTSQGLGVAAVYDRGEWRVVFTRALATADSANDLQFETGRPIPIAFFAWDGSNGEQGTRASVSTWYYLALAEPVPARALIAPLMAAVLAFGLGVWVVRRANRRVN